MQQRDIAQYRITSKSARHTERFIYEVMYTSGRSRWPRGLRHELSSLVRTLGSWDRMPHKAWMFVQCAFFLYLCYPVSR
jgi:hypothetical protein